MHITDHAYKRARERMGLKPRALRSLAQKALTDGITHSRAKGVLNNYLSAIYLKYENCNNMRIYGHYIYLFQSDVLITIYHLPNKFKKYADQLARKQYKKR